MMTVQLYLVTFMVLLIDWSGSTKIDLENDKSWTNVCGFDSGDGGMQVSGKLLSVIEDPEKGTLVLVENKHSDVYIKCVNEKGNAKIYDENGHVLAESNPEASSVQLLLWKAKLTTFWKSEKYLKCTKRSTGCSVTVIEIKDGTQFRSNCTQGEGEGEEGVLWCNVKDWLENAFATKNHMMECNETDQYDNEAHYKFSIFNQETKKWNNCGEYDQDRKKTHRDQNVHFMKCKTSGLAVWGEESLLVKMEKIHASKTSIGLSFLGAGPDCQESTYFMIEDNSNESVEPFLSKSSSLVIAVLLFILFMILFVCVLKVCKGKMLTYEPSRTLTSFTNQSILICQ
eukprot:GFUD01024218.1.p1 GENE.GFUD01024218.1~~GFUD01024218.1.p1  ORF type:complete len:341 (+),score=71.36 GFUD01024218.1:357-1379(+)